MADAGTGSYGILRVNAWESANNAAGNWSDVSWELWLIENGGPNSTWTGDAIGANVQVNGGTVWSGAFSFDWRSGGNQSTRIAAGTTRVGHNADGSGGATVQGNIANTGTSGAGGPTSVAQGVGLATLKVTPGTPSGVTGTRVSDTQVKVAWGQSSASNGQPTSNTIRCKVNDGAYSNVVTISPATSTTVTVAANQKLVYGVQAANAAGSSAWSADSAPVFTTPAAPTDVAASKDASLNIVLGWTPHVAFAEHQHVIVHGTVADGVTTWDASPLATVPAGTSSYTHATPDASKVHIYQVYAKNTDTGALASAAVTSNSVQLLVAPNKPTLPVFGAYADKAKSLVFSWTHNPVDTTGQTAYEVGYSTNGGTTWTSTGKVASTTPSKTFAANSYAAGAQLTLRVRTWGQAASGGSDGTGASPWSDLAAVTFKTRPAVTILSPMSATPYAQSQLAVQLGFAQAEGAAFVSASITLSQGATVLEQRTTTTLASTVLSTRVDNLTSYKVSVTVTDSNGLVSDVAAVTFNVQYTAPVPATVEVIYLDDSGIAQLNITIPAAGTGQAAASKVTVSRSIDGVSESVVDGYPAAASLTILDTTPTIYGDNVYTVTTVSADGATSDVVDTLTTDETEWAFLSGGEGFSQIVKFGGELKPQSTPTVDSSLVKASGRLRPIGLYGKTGGLVVAGTGDIVTGYGSSAEEIEAHLLIPGKHCYRDPSGRRMFGQVSGQLSRDSYAIGTLAYTVTETS